MAKFTTGQMVYDTKGNLFSIFSEMRNCKGIYFVVDYNGNFDYKGESSLKNYDGMEKIAIPQIKVGGMVKVTTPSETFIGQVERIDNEYITLISPVRKQVTVDYVRPI